VGAYVELQISIIQMRKIMFAPIILFVYNRAKLTQQTVEALLKNKEAEETVLYVFADGAKPNATAEQFKKVEEVREYIHTIRGFKDVVIEEAAQNKGLANSVISGVTKVMEKHGKAIIVEDDLLTSKNFLHYMNTSLDMYENDEEVICIHGYSIIKDAPIKEKTYFQIGADCWGWATWKRGWNLFNADSKALMKIISADKQLEDIFTYNHTYPYTKMLRKQIKGKIDSWAIRWYASAVVNNKLCLYPAKSLVKNVGYGEDATHCSNTESFEATIDIDETTRDFPKIEINESLIMRRSWERQFREMFHGRNRHVSLWVRFRNKIRRLLHIKNKKERRMLYLSKCADKSRKDGIVRNIHGEELIVSLTTYGKNINTVHLAIESIMQGTLKPNRIILWLSEQEFKGKELPEPIRKQMLRGLEVDYCKDYRSYKKLIPTLKKYSDAIIVTIDDDVMYEDCILENLMLTHKTHPHSICANRVCEILLDDAGKVRRYVEWPDIFEGDEVQGKNIFFTGVGGVLYVPGCLSEEVFNEDIFMKDCQFADDVWFFAMAKLKGTPIVRSHTISKKGEDYIEIPNIQESPLHKINTNSISHGNDTQISRIFAKYDILKLLQQKS
jgi:hypothetical protein